MKKIIKTEKENAVALKFVERLMAGDPEIKSDEGMLLTLLADAIQGFERRYDVPALKDALDIIERIMK